MSYFISNKSSTMTLKAISQFYFDTSTTHCYNSIFQSSSILMRFLSQIFCAFKLAAARTSVSQRAFCQIVKSGVSGLSRFAKLKERELLSLFMLGFFYGSYRKNEENFEFLQENTKVFSRAIRFLVEENFEFYKKIRKFLAEL